MMLGQPRETARDYFLMIAVETRVLIDQNQGGDGRRGGQGGRRKFSGPVAIRIPFGEKGGKSGLVGAIDAGWIDGGHQ